MYREAEVDQIFRKVAPSPGEHFIPLVIPSKCPNKKVFLMSTTKGNQRKLRRRLGTCNVKFLLNLCEGVSSAKFGAEIGACRVIRSNLHEGVMAPNLA